MANAFRPVFKSYIRPMIPFPKRKTLRKWFPSFHTKNVVHLLEERGVDCVLDIGANTGQYVEKLRSANYKKKIVSFEPIPQIQEELERKARRDKNWIIAPNCALGDENGELTINIYKDTSLSSPYALRDNTAPVRREIVPLYTLDELFEEYYTKGETVFMKLDVQGYEKHVLEGASKSLKNIVGIQIELSLSQCYDSDPSYLEIFQYLDKKGFTPHFFLPVLNRRKYGREMQIDCILFKEPKAKGKKAK